MRAVARRVPLAVDEAHESERFLHVFMVELMCDGLWRCVEGEVRAKDDMMVEKLDLEMRSSRDGKGASWKTGW